MLFDTEEYRGLKWFRSVNDAFIILESNIDFKEDIQQIEKTKIVEDLGHYKNRSYFRILHYLNGLSIGDHSFPFSEIKDLFKQIQNSDLIENDKEFLYREIKDDLLSEYIAVIGLERSLIISPKF